MSSSLVAGTLAQVPGRGSAAEWLELRQATIREDDLDTDQVICGDSVFLLRIPSPPPSVSSLHGATPDQESVIRPPSHLMR
jgi:hypothetical protein